MSNRKAESRKSSTRKVRVADGASPRKSARPDFRLVAGAAFFGAIASLLLLLFMLEGPETARQDQDGGITVMEKTSVARSEPDISAIKPAPIAVQQPNPANAEQPMLQPVREPDTVSPAMVDAMTQPDVPLPSQRKPVGEQKADPSAAPVPLPQPQPKPRRATAPALPWQQETKLAGNSSAARLASLPPVEAGGVRASLPSRSELKSWVKSNAREFVGGVDADGMPLYRFDLWLEAPEDMRSQVRTVSYAYLAPSAQPAEQSSSDAKNGFRVKFGAASCAEKATVTLLLVDGRERNVTVDGCRILN